MTSSPVSTGSLTFEAIASEPRNAEPVTFALPLAEGVLAEPDGLRLLTIDQFNQLK